MKITKPMTMAETVSRLTTVHGFEKIEAQALVRRLHDNSTTFSKRGMSYDAKTFSLDYTLTGARYGRGHFIFMEDDDFEERS